MVIFPLISAQTTTQGFYAQNAQVNISQTCAPCTFITLEKVKLPDGQDLFIIQNMTNNGSSYDLPFNSTNQIGQYIVTTCGNPNGLVCVNFDFFVNPSGNRDDNLWTNFIILFFLSFVSFVVGIKFGTDQPMYSYLSAFMLFSVGVYSIIYGFGGYQNILTTAFALINWGLGLFFLVQPWFTGKRWDF